MEAAGGLRVRGSQYAANEYRAILAARGIAVSMRRRGDCWDNAPMESFNDTIKVECVYPTHFATRDEARRALRGCRQVASG